ncbi:phosphatase PAP2 family protein [Nonlabens marinus]|uniref:Phosphoesterase, PA-phosphatase related n=1 Tax=Nonlabens marinus S1-08 TaxID=1454201 RepID=W8VNU4_9FLAO|nr:phosphatase PAP2 family protein [Nonlabens marinus]BAO54080.1 phosphoesterase, PA-phosphatase related [Nonlabens marinus S1-08]
MRYLIAFCLLVCSSSVFAQNEYVFDRGETNLWQDFTYDMGNVFQGVGFAYSRPLYWQGDDFLKLGGVAAGTMALYAFDEPINTAFSEDRDGIPKLLLDYGNYAGAPQNNYGLSGAVYLTGLFTKNEKLRRTGVLLISSATATGFLQQLTKSATGRARPGGGFGSNHFRPFGGSSVYRSFPSGHAVLTFTNAHVIAKQFKNPWVKAGIYTIGVIPGISRIYDEQHWASDVFLSWAMSYFMVEAIDLYLDRKYETKYNDDGSIKTSSLDLNFSLNSVGLSYSF